MAEIRKYVDLIGPAEVRVNSEGDLDLYFYDATGNIINEGKPFSSNVNSKGGRLKFQSLTILVELNEEGFAIHKDTLMQLAPGITWENAELPEPETMPEMNPIKPPPPRR